MIIRNMRNEARNPRTKQVYVLQGNYGYGWDDLVEYDMGEYQNAKADYKSYAENERYPHRIITRRVPNPDYVKPSESMNAVKIKDLPEGKYFTLKYYDDAETVPESAIWIASGMYDGDYWAHRASNVNQERIFKGDKLVYLY